MSGNKYFNYKEVIYSVFHQKIRDLKVQVVLFLLTVCTISIGAVLLSEEEYISMTSILKSIPYTSVVIIILSAHSLGHYIQARLQKVKVLAPYFIPSISFGGTVGAYTKMQWPITDRNALIKIFATGPICGFTVSWIVLSIGLFLSDVKDLHCNSVIIGNPIIMRVTLFAIWGSLPDTKYVVLHPMAYIGWLGIFYNFCHLLPIGKFDGGRLIYALFGYRITTWVSFMSISALMILGYFTSDWLRWSGIAIVGIISTIGFRQQYPSDHYSQPLEKSLFIILGMIAIIFIISFTPIPLPVIKE